MIRAALLTASSILFRFTRGGGVTKGRIEIIMPLAKSTKISLIATGSVVTCTYFGFLLQTRLMHRHLVNIDVAELYSHILFRSDKSRNWRWNGIPY